MAELTKEQLRRLELLRQRKKLDDSMSYDGTHPVQQQQDAVRSVYDFATVGVPQGLALGAGDEIAAGAMTAIDVLRGKSRAPVDIYKDRLGKARSSIDEAEERNPSAVAAGEMTGGLATGMFPLAKALQMVRGSSLPVRMGAGALAGGGTAALQGFLDGRGGAVQRLENAADPVPLATGAALGGAAPAIGRIAGAMTGRVAGKSNANVRAMGVDRRAAEQIAKAFRRDSNFTRDADLYLRGIGDEAMLSDLGTNTRQTARGLAGLPGEAGQEIALTSAQRQRGRVGRVADDINESLGMREDMTARNDALKAERRQQAKTAYDAFYRQNVDMTPDLRETLKRADVSGGLADLRKIGKARGWDVDSYLNGDVAAVSGEFLDEASKAIRDASGAAYKAGKGNLGGSLADINRELLDAAPTLKSVRQQYADDSLMIEVSEAGKNILDSKQSSAEFNKWWKSLPPEAQSEFRLAARDAIANKIGSAVREDTASLNVFGPTNTMAKIKTVYGSDAARRLERRMLAERAMAETDNRVRAGSDTAATSAFQQEMAPERPAAQGLVGRVDQIGGRVLDAGIDAVLKRSPEIATRDMARALTAQGSTRDQLVNALMRDSLTAARRNKAANATNRLVTRLLTGAAVAVPSQVR